MANTIIPLEWFIKGAVQTYLSQMNFELKNITIRKRDDFARAGFDARYEIKNKEQK